MMMNVRLRRAAHHRLLCAGHHSLYYCLCARFAAQHACVDIHHQSL